MAVLSIQALKDLQLTNKLPIWRVSTANEKIPINVQNDAQLSVEESAEKLERFLSQMAGDYVIVKLYERPPQKRNLETDGAPAAFMVKVKLKSINEPQFVGAAPGQELDRLFELKEEIHQLKLEQVKKEYEEREPSAINRIIDKLANNEAFVGALTGFVMKIAAPAPVPGVGQPTPGHQASGHQDTEKLISIVDRLKQFESEPIRLLEQLTIYIEANPTVLPQVKAIIGA